MTLYTTWHPVLRDATAGLDGAFRNSKHPNPPVRIDCIRLTDEWQDVCPRLLHPRDGAPCFSAPTRSW